MDHRDENILCGMVHRVPASGKRDEFRTKYKTDKTPYKFLDYCVKHLLGLSEAAPCGKQAPALQDVRRVPYNRGNTDSFYFEENGKAITNNTVGGTSLYKSCSGRSSGLSIQSYTRGCGFNKMGRPPHCQSLP